MLYFGNPPYLECSEHGNRAFSDKHVRIPQYENKTICEIYKPLIEYYPSSDWRGGVDGHLWSNFAEIRDLYRKMWRMYLSDNPELFKIILQYNGTSNQNSTRDPMYQCAAYEIWKFRKRIIKVDVEKWIAQRLNSPYSQAEIIKKQTRMWNANREI